LLASLVPLMPFHNGLEGRSRFVISPSGVFTTDIPRGGTGQAFLVTGRMPNR
jgi:hypothetical protein